MPLQWNHLPVSVWKADSLITCKRRLETFPFDQVYIQSLLSLAYDQPLVMMIYNFRLLVEIHGTLSSFPLLPLSVCCSVPVSPKISLPSTVESSSGSWLCLDRGLLLSNYHGSAWCSLLLFFVLFFFSSSSSSSRISTMTQFHIIYILSHFLT